MEINPYAPPKAESPVTSEASGKTADFRTQRRPVLLCILLTFVTLGLYPAIWLLRRRPFLDAFAQPRNLGAYLPIASIAFSVIGFGVDIAIGVGAGFEGLDRFLTIASGLTYLLACMRVATMLRTEFWNSRLRIDVSSLFTFFFGIYYLQYKINQAADATTTNT